MRQSVLFQTVFQCLLLKTTEITLFVSCHEIMAQRVRRWVRDGFVSTPFRKCEFAQWFNPPGGQTFFEKCIFLCFFVCSKSNT